MTIRVNGSDQEAESGLDITGLLQRLGAHPEGVAVALNGEVIPKGQRDRVLSEGDRVEVIRAVGGG